MSTPKIYTLHGSTVVEWTPSFVLTRSRSLWPDNPRGKALTNRRILQYQRDGRYGPDAQAHARAMDAVLTKNAQDRRVRALRNAQERARQERENDLLTLKYV